MNPIGEPSVLVAGLLAAAAVLAAVSRIAAGGGRPRRLAHEPARPARWPRPRRVSRRREAAGNVVVADWCDDIARALRSGAGLAAAITQATVAHPALQPAIGPALAAVGRGRTLAAGLAAAPADPSSPAGLGVSVLRTCAELGGPAAAPLERVAATLRTRAAIAEEYQAHSAQALLSARVLTTIPLALLALLVLTEPRVRASLGTRPGLGAVGAGVTLNLAGWRWMRRIIGRPP